MAKILDEAADTTEEAQDAAAVAASDYVGDEGDGDDDDCRCHGITKR